MSYINFVSVGGIKLCKLRSGLDHLFPTASTTETTNNTCLIVACDMCLELP